MFYVIRIILFLLIVLLAYLINRKTKTVVFFSKRKNPWLYEKYYSDKNFRRKSVLTNCILIASLFALGFIIQYPFEGFFLEFSSLESSLSYKCLETENIEIFDYDDCVFIINNENQEIYTVTKSGDKYRLVDFASSDADYIMPEITHSIYESDSEMTVSSNNFIYGEQTAKYNKDVNKTFYPVYIKLDEQPGEGEVKIDGNPLDFYKQKTYVDLFKNEDDIWLYTYVDSGEPLKEFNLDAGFVNNDFHITPYIKMD